MFIKFASLIVSQQNHKYLQNDGQTPHKRFIISILNNDQNELSTYWPIVVGLYSY